MKKNNEALENAFEKILSSAAQEVAENEAEEMKAEAEKYKDYEFSKEHNQKMKKLFAVERKKKLAKKMSVRSKKAACIVLAVLLVSGTVVFNADALKIKFLNYVFDPDAPGTNFSFGYKKGEVFNDGYIDLEYIPIGYNLEKQNITGCAVYYIFLDENKTRSFSFSISEGDNSGIGIDTEGGSVKDYELNGHEAVLTTSKNANSIVWYNGEYVFSVISELPQSEIIKIAENFVEKKSYKFSGNFSLKYVPEGFNLIDSNKDFVRACSYYENGESNFSVAYVLARGFRKFNSEGKETPIKINNREGTIRRSDEMTVIDIYDGDYVYTFDGNIPEAELIKIAEGFEPEME